jgi:hypothetical protein
MRPAAAEPPAASAAALAASNAPDASPRSLRWVGRDLWPTAGGEGAAVAAGDAACGGGGGGGEAGAGAAGSLSLAAGALGAGACAAQAPPLNVEALASVAALLTPPACWIRCMIDDDA